MPTILPPSTLQRRSLQVLASYLVFAFAAAIWRTAQGTGSLATSVAYAIIALAMVISSRRSESRVARFVADWLPLLALPVLYAGIPATILHADGRLFDSVVQGWDRWTFGTDPARTMAGAMPNVWLSEVLHAAYLSYYLIIYGPPLLMYLGRDRVRFHSTVLAFTVTMTLCFVAFCVTPVEGPRYAWPPPPGVPEGPMRSLVLGVLDAGSSRGTAFPSSHLAIALSMSLSSLSWRRWVGVMVSLATLLLGVGAVYGGFHYSSDMGAGVAVGLAGWGVSRWLERVGGEKAVVA